MKRLLSALAILAGIATVTLVLALFLSDDIGLSDNVVLVWHLDERIIDYAARPDWPWDDQGRESSLIDLYLTLEEARTDERVRGLALYVHGASFGIAKAQQIRRQLDALREAGKFVDCYLETAGEGGNGTLTYFVATACENIHLAPGGDVNLLGLHADRSFFRGTLDKLKIEPQFAHVGKYKSAVESYTQEESSGPAAEALEAVLDSYYGGIVETIAVARQLDTKVVEALIDNAPYNAAEALDAGLVDRLGYPDEFETFIDERVDGDPTLMTVEEYAPGSGSGRTVAMVFAQGSIRRGYGGAEPWSGALYIGSRDLGQVLSDLRDDDSVDAVVLRIDSPGGSALASDLILREVDLLAAEKPLVVSMSDLAASGGYYIATRAHHIVAEAATLTGSIGVFGGKLVTRQFEQEMLGITHDSFKRGENADIYSSLEPFSEAQTQRVQSLMQTVYDTFVGHVAAGREMTEEEVEAVAQGRVWTGSDAFAVGLVDSLGGFGEALRLVRQEMDIEPDAELRLEFYPRPPGVFDYLLGRAQPFLPIELPEPLKALVREHSNLLELPPAVADLARPF